jgi:glutathione synthase/RimK-type ligase-like ATP-grasp enzyme
VVDLIAAQVAAGALPAAVAARAIETHAAQLKKVLPEGTRMRLDWRHNLEQGAHPVMVEDQALRQKLHHLALTCARELNIYFASIDIIEARGQQLVLEVNAGVMMEKFIRLAPNGYATAKAIYAKAVEYMFADID